MNVAYRDYFLVVGRLFSMKYLRFTSQHGATAPELAIGCTPRSCSSVRLSEPWASPVQRLK